MRYSGLPVLQGASLALNAGETVCIVGSNGAGKSMLLRAIMGSQRAFEGRIAFAGREIQRMRTEEIVRLGIVYVPEEKMLFQPLAVEENLLLGAYTLSDSQQIRKNLDGIYDLFPRLQRTAPAARIDPFRRGAADGRDRRGALVHRKLLILDEPSPGCRRRWWARHRRGGILQGQGMSILLVEQNVRRPWNWPNGGTCCRPAASSVRAPGRNCCRSISSGNPF